MAIARDRLNLQWLSRCALQAEGLNPEQAQAAGFYDGLQVPDQVLSEAREQLHAGIRKRKLLVSLRAACDAIMQFQDQPNRTTNRQLAQGLTTLNADDVFASLSLVYRVLLRAYTITATHDQAMEATMNHIFHTVSRWAAATPASE